ncbi:MAG: ABC transporter ATP-binding protein [Synechococcales bacterium]|nr:ABC transporter ATP-binding protein [Synechococcales bacterium]
MIEVEHLSKIYGESAAILDVTFSVEKGEIVGFLGPNGAGKTTTMRILSGYLPATSGTAKVAGFEVHEDSMAVRQRIGYLPETPPLYPDMTIEGFLHFVARLKGVSAGDRPQRVEYAIRRCNLMERRKMLIRKLSKGFRQRVGIAQAIVHDPPVIILDEPTVGLDPRQIIDVRNLIKGLAGDHTVLLSTHILPEVSMTCDRVTIISKGQVVATNKTDNITQGLVQSYAYEVETAGNWEEVQQVLRSLSGVSQVERLEGQGMMGDRLRLKVISENQTEIGSDLATILVQRGLSLFEMRRVQASLEDIFLELTMEDNSTGEMRDDRPAEEIENPPLANEETAIDETTDKT